MIHIISKIIHTRVAQVNKDALEDAGDDHEMFAEVDNWYLRDHRREATRVQNRRNVELGSLHNQQKPRTGKDGFSHHTREIKRVKPGVGGTYRNVKSGQPRVRLTDVLGTFGSPSSGHFLVA
jgi:hypothetical protein